MMNKKFGDWIIICFIGLCVIIFALYTFLFGTSITRMTCERLENNSGTCILTEDMLMKDLQKKIPINTIKKAYVKETILKEKVFNKKKEEYETKINKSYKVILECDSNDVPLRKKSYTLNNQKQVVDDINNFIVNKDIKKLEVQLDDKENNIYILGIVILVGIYIILRGLHRKESGSSRNKL